MSVRVQTTVKLGLKNKGILPNKKGEVIKRLIEDIAFDKIKLSQGLTRSKLIENKIKNETLKKWLIKELEGYEYGDTYLPSYRKVNSTIFLTIEFPFDRVEKFPVSLPDSVDKGLRDIINYHLIIEPVSIVEQQIEFLNKPKGYIRLSPQQVNIFSNLYKQNIESYGGIIKHGEREVGRVQYQNVLKQTKQKIIDILMELDNEFPNLIDEYNMNKDSNDKVHNIVTNNIYGNNNPTNIAAGSNIDFIVTSTNVTLEDETKLKSLGVTDIEIKEIKEIVTQNTDDKKILTSKAMKWLGSVSASVAGRGLYDNLPQITEFVQRIIN